MARLEHNGIGVRGKDLRGIKPPKHLQGKIFLASKSKKRKYVFAARDRCDGTADRIRCVRTKRYKYIRNFHPERPYTQFNGYKKHQYPMLTLMQVLHKQGKLTPEQARFMAPTRPKEELYDLVSDPHELNNLAEYPKHQKVLKQLRAALDKWIKQTGDMGEIPEDTQIEADQKERMLKAFKQRMQSKGLSPDISDEDYLRWWEKKLLSK